MPQSTELILELKWEDVTRIALEYFERTDKEEFRKQGWRDEDFEFVNSGGTEDPEEYKDMILNLAGSAVDDRLAEIHRELCAARFGEPVLVNKYGYERLVYSTSVGPRELSSFGIQSYGYEGEGMEWVGIGMTSRYSPQWTDWREAHGGSGHFRLDAEAMEMIEEARAAIAEVIPEIKDAPCTAAPNFY